VSLLLFGRRAVAELATVLEAYAESADRVSLESWRERSWGSRVLENLARLTAALQ
jgi:hypothetical protein